MIQFATVANCCHQSEVVSGLDDEDRDQGQCRRENDGL